MTQSYGSTYAPRPVEALGENARAGFVVRTYNHLFAAIVGFVAVEYFFFTTGLAEVMAQAMLGTNWLLVLGGFILVSWLATRTAHNAVSLGSQYLALAGFVVAEAVIFVPMLYIAAYYTQGGVIESAATVTLLGFGGLTAVAFWTRKDFSFLETDSVASSINAAHPASETIRREGRPHRQRAGPSPCSVRC